METLRETPSGPTWGVPTAIGAPLQTTSTVLVAPSGLANVNKRVGGEVSTVLPAAGDDETNVLSAASTRVAATPPAMEMPTRVAKAKRRARRTARGGGEVLFMLVAQR
jgi:hypothetical protein